MLSRVVVRVRGFGYVGCIVLGFTPITGISLVLLQLLVYLALVSWLRISNPVVERVVVFHARCLGASDRS